MPKLKILSGEEIVDALKNFGFKVHNQKGSHIKLKRISKEGFGQTLTIPLHKELDRGTIKAIYNQALRYIPENELQKYFYSK